MYSNAELYTKLYSFKKYDQEVEYIRSKLQQYNIADKSSLLELGCGTGSHMAFLKAHYSMSGLDLSAEFVAYCQKNHPTCKIMQADMSQCHDPNSPHVQYDAILSLFSCIGYVHPIEKLQSTMQCCFHKLRPGGLLMIEPWFFLEQISDKVPSLTTYEDDDLKIARVSVSELRPAKISSASEDEEEKRIARYDFHFTVAARGAEKVQVFNDVHDLFNYTQAEYKVLEAIANAGFEAIEYVKEEGALAGRGLFIARKPS